ncbi:hypothetical protein GCM10028895_43310 [Pontibacter rugosus]
MSKANWKTVKEYQDITYKKADGVARIAFNRPNVRNAFRPKTVAELFEAFLDAREDTSIGVVLLSAEGPLPKMAFTPSAVAAIRMRAATRAMWMKKECHA